jgi:glycine cleavage system aminomethyltransferase T
VTLEREVSAVRSSAGLTTLSHVSVLRVTGNAACSTVDAIVPASLAIRDSHLRHTLLLADDAHPIADVYVGNDDGDLLLVCEPSPGLDRGALTDLLRAHVRGDARIDDLSETHTLLSLNGPYAWEVMAKLEGPEVVAFPFMSFYHPTPDATYFRAGKTGEYGYDLLVPHARAGALVERLLDTPIDVAAVSLQALRHCAFENWSFDPLRSLPRHLTPIELQLQWRVSYDKEYPGSEALRRRRAAGATQRTVAVVSEHALAAGDVVTLSGRPIGVLLDATWSMTCARFIAMALVDVAYAYAGVEAYEVGGARVRTVSAPFVDNKSLYVNPYRDTYAPARRIG